MKRRTWTPRTVIEAIRERHDRGQPLTMVAKTDRGLAAAAWKHFGRWSQAVLAAGLQPSPRKFWTQQLVVDAIRARHAQNLSLTFVWRHDKSLYMAAVRHWGGWQQAVLAAGFLPRTFQRWSRQRVLDEVREWRRKPHVNLRKSNRPLARAIVKYFGSLRAVLDALGLKSHRSKWPKHRVIEAIQDAHVRGRPLTRDGCFSIPLLAAAQRHFGTWGKALRAAGICTSRRAPARRRTKHRRTA